MGDQRIYDSMAVSIEKYIRNSIPNEVIVYHFQHKKVVEAICKSNLQEIFDFSFSTCFNDQLGYNFMCDFR